MGFRISIYELGSKEGIHNSTHSTSSSLSFLLLPFPYVAVQSWSHSLKHKVGVHPEAEEIQLPKSRCQSSSRTTMMLILQEESEILYGVSEREQVRLFIDSDINQGTRCSSEQRHSPFHLPGCWQWSLTAKPSLASEGHLAQVHNPFPGAFCNLNNQ